MKVILERDLWSGIEWSRCLPLNGISMLLMSSFLKVYTPQSTNLEYSLASIAYNPYFSGKSPETFLCISFRPLQYAQYLYYQLVGS